VRLPLLDALRKRLQNTAPHCFRGWACIYVQHILRSNLACVDFLRAFGLQLSTLIIVGKAYSTNEETLLEYLQEGIDAQSIGRGYAYDEPFDSKIISCLGDALGRLSRAGTSRLLIIDEGGLAMQAIARCPHPLPQLAVAELTSRGARHYHLVANRTPIVDVARSHTKKSVEAPIIARSMAESFEREISAFRPSAGMRIGVLGRGAIGNALTIELESRGFHTNWYDTARTNPAIPSPSVLVGRSDILLSSTGEGADWWPLIGDVRRPLIFGNTGSSDIEFHLWRMRREVIDAGGAFEVEAEGEPWRGEVRIQMGEVRLVFWRGGFPINFDGSADPIPPASIQLTRALLMAGAVQAVMSRSVGIEKLDDEIQEFLRRQFASL